MKKCRTLVIITFIVIISIKLCVIFMRKTQAFKDDCNDVSQVSFDLSSNNSGKSDNRLLSTNSSNFSTLEMSNLTHGNPELLSRKKRYILFPDGSTFTAAVCSTQTVIGSDTGTAEYTESFVWALVYDLPSTLAEFGLMRRRKRRDIHRTMAQLLDRANINGAQCVQKSICEMQDALRPKHGIAEEILRLLFTIPQEKFKVADDEDEKEDTLSSRTSRGYEDCNTKYPECRVSLLQMLIGLQVESIKMRR